MNTFNHIFVKKVKVDPTKSQMETFDFWFRRCKILYNVSLEEKIIYYKSSGKYLNVYDQKKELVDIKDFDPSWYDVPNKTLQEIIFRVDKSFKSFFKGGGFPKYKSDIDSVEFVKTDVRLIGGKLYLPKIKTHIKSFENIQNGWTSVRLSKDVSGYYLNFVYQNMTKRSLDNNHVLGIDLGLKDLYTDSNGVKVKRFSKKLISKYHKRIEELNRSLSKKKRGSIKFKKVKKQLSKAYKKLNNTKKDYLHKLSTSLVKNSKESIISIGDIKIQKIVNKSNKGLIKSFYTNSLGIFKQMINYKSIKFNKEVILVDERLTSKTCSCCGNIKYDLTLKDRIYNCLKCGNSIDRDHNGAINMKLLGSSILEQRIVFDENSKIINSVTFE